MLYPKLKFTNPPKNRPFFYTNFVQTVDGKVQVLDNAKDYWPIGSKTDYKVLTQLRSYADCLIHGGNLAREFGKITLQSINKPEFKQMRVAKGKNTDLPYYVITKHPKSLSQFKSATIFSDNLSKLVLELENKGYKHILVEGGPNLLGSFLEKGIINEIFLTIAPKIYGNVKNRTLTLVEGYLFPSKSIKHLTLLSVKKSESELYLRYKVN